MWVGGRGRLGPGRRLALPSRPAARRRSAVIRLARKSPAFAGRRGAEQIVVDGRENENTTTKQWRKAATTPTGRPSIPSVPLAGTRGAKRELG